MITLQDVLLFEQLRQKSFMDFDGTEDDLVALMYVHDNKNRRDYTYKFYTRFVKEKQPKELRKFVAMVNADMAYINQYSHPVDSEDKLPSEQNEPKGRLTPAIQALIFQGGINPQWLLCQGMDMLPVLTDGYEKMMQRQAEDRRFWTMLSMSPHMKPSDRRKLEHSLKFPWEKKQIQPEISEKLNSKIAHFFFGNKHKEE